MENIKKTFNDMPLGAPILAQLEQLGFTEPTEIQGEVIPLLLSREKVDIHGQAQTGTGKTLAFGLPLLTRINPEERVTQALVIAPTRELAVQTADSLIPFAKAMGVTLLPVYGGASMTDQMRALKRGVHIVVGTPGRINDHLSRGTLKLDQLKTLVLDEADIMLDMGFREEVDEILEFSPKEREIWLFSATVKQGIADLMRGHMRDTVSISTSRSQVGSTTTKQYYCAVPMMHRLGALSRFVEATPDFYGFVFCQTKMLTSEVAEQLLRRGYRVGALHGDMSQSQRNAVMKKFKDREYSIVVATDVAGRGIDVQDLTHVVNYSLPEDYESYLHRTGRTGRAGKDGIAITFINNHQVREMRTLERKFNIKIQPISLPSRDEIVQGRLAKAGEYLTGLQSDVKLSPELQTGLDTLMQQFDQAQLGRMVTSFVYDKFLKSVQEDRFEEVVSRHNSSNHNVSAEDATHQEIVLFIGSDDGVSQDEVRDFVLQNGTVPAEAISKVRLIKRRTFVHVANEHAASLLEALRESTLGGRKLTPRVAEQQSGERSARSPRRRFGGSEGRGFGGSEGREGRGGWRGKSSGGRSSSHGFGVYSSEGAERSSGEFGGRERGGERRERKERSGGDFRGGRGGNGGFRRERRDRWAER